MTIIVYMIPNQTIPNSTRRNPNLTDRTKPYPPPPPILTSRPSNCIKLLNLYVKNYCKLVIFPNKKLPPFPHPALFREREGKKKKKKKIKALFCFLCIGEGGVRHHAISGSRFKLKLNSDLGDPSIFPCVRSLE